MAEWPEYQLPAPPVLTPFSLESLGACIAGPILQGWGSFSSTQNANEAIFFPFRLTTWETAYQLLYLVGATSSGNIDVGIYDSQKNRIVSSGSTAMSATVNTVQELNITDTVLPPGDYLLAVATDNTTGTLFGSGLADERSLSSIPIYEQASAFPLPDPCVPVIATGTVPSIRVVGIQFRSTF